MKRRLTISCLFKVWNLDFVYAAHSIATQLCHDKAQRGSIIIQSGQIGEWVTVFTRHMNTYPFFFEIVSLKGQRQCFRYGQLTSNDCVQYAICMYVWMWMMVDLEHCRLFLSLLCHLVQSILFIWKRTLVFYCTHTLFLFLFIPSIFAFYVLLVPFIYKTIIHTLFAHMVIYALAYLVLSSCFLCYFFSHVFVVFFMLLFCVSPLLSSNIFSLR